MATKDSMLKKKWIRDGVISLVVLVALAGGGMLLSNMDDDAQTEKQNKGNESNQMRSEHDSIEHQLGTGFEVNSFYDIYSKNHSNNLQLKREDATRWMSALHEKNHLTNLSVTISPITDAAIDLGGLKSGTMVKSEVQVTFGGITDSSIYGFIESLERRMPGMMVLRELKFTRNGDVSRAVVMGLGDHHITPLVTGEISFNWLGIRPDTEKADTPNGH